MDFDWKSALKVVAPVLGTAVGGPFGAMAGKLVADALGCDNTDKAIEAAVKNATPDQLLALKAADNNFTVRMKELGIEHDKLEYADTANARAAGTARQVSRTWWLEPLLALLVVMGFFIACGGLIYVATKNLTLDPQAHDIIVMLLGVLAAKFSDVFGYYFGSSSGSAAKTDALTRK